MSFEPPAQGLYDPQFEHDSCGVGFVANFKGVKSHALVRDTLQVLINLDHRGACGCEANTGDGAGILTQIPDKFFRKVCGRLGIQLPTSGDYGVGVLYMPPDYGQRRRCREVVERTASREGLKFLGWRDVPTDPNAANLGKGARSLEPNISQFFVQKPDDCATELDFERLLYVFRRLAYKEISKLETLPQREYFYHCSLSCRTVVYKGMLTPGQVAEYFPDLRDPDYESAIGLTHSRFSTNTFPNWQRSHPYRYIAHNGEINTLRGNISWMRARESRIKGGPLGSNVKDVFPVVASNGSDSAMFDNVLEFLTLNGRSLPHAVMMMIPEPWDGHEHMDDEKRAFYEYHSCLMEPWDGPASICFTDGQVIGNILDRNGLRPSRYYVTEDTVILSSEAGVLPIPEDKIVRKGRVSPGEMFFVDTIQGRVLTDEEVKRPIFTGQPYGQWLKDNLVVLDDLPVAEEKPTASSIPLVKRQQAFGFSYEDIGHFMAPMAKNGVELITSMGTDTPMAVLSDKPLALFEYFKQLFAQVTNPPIDSIREEIITSTITTLGSEGNLIDPKPESARLILCEQPVLSDSELAKIRNIRRKGFKSVTLPILFPADQGSQGLEDALENLFVEASAAIAKGANLLILSDRDISAEKAPIPSLLAVAGLHHHLMRAGSRTKVSLILESGEPRDVHAFAILIGYGCSAINPYLAFETLGQMITDGQLGGDITKAVKNFIKAATKGVVKTMAKMGISTIQSYRGAQQFEAVGLGKDLVEKYFTGTPSRIGGFGLDVVAEDTLKKHTKAFFARKDSDNVLDAGGKHQWRSNGERHLFNPVTIHKLQRSTREKNFKLFQEYTSTVDNQAKEAFTLRGLMDFKFPSQGIPIEEVESVNDIVKRFKTGAMSYGSISKEAHEALAIAMNKLGGKSNTGEGGEDPERYTWKGANGESKNSAIKQVASGRFGVTSWYLVNARELQIKMAQGAKPGEGGQLPGGKVNPPIAKVRHSTPGVGLISPPPHHDIYSIEDLAELIHDLKNANHHARISVKLVSEVGVGTIAAGVAKAHADVVLISGHDGGTGASPVSSIHHAGLPWELGLAETHQTLLLNGLRDRIVVETDGQLKTGRDVVIGALLGAEEFGFATAPLVVLGCIMMRACHLNTCPVGVATQDPRLRAKFAGEVDAVVSFFHFIAEEVRQLMAKLGIRKLTDMVGRADLLEMRETIEHYKSRGLDYSNILYRPEIDGDQTPFCRFPQDHGIDRSYDMTTLVPACEAALERGEKVTSSFPVRNVHRVVGTILGSEISRRHGQHGLPEDTVTLNFNGTAGQSFGAFIPPGLTLKLTGDANDYFGKGLSGGKVIVRCPSKATYPAEENIIIGNVAFFGATAGEGYINGRAGERFCVRNSGVRAVVEGVGDHGCEYMTGGSVTILGPTGRNFGAGMSGGIVYLLDTDNTAASRCNLDMATLLPITEAAEIEVLKGNLEHHIQHTGSRQAKRLLENWPAAVASFKKFVPNDYARMLACIQKAQAAGLTGESALEAAFAENMKDPSRVSGN